MISSGGGLFGNSFDPYDKSLSDRDREISEDYQRNKMSEKEYVDLYRKGEYSYYQNSTIRCVVCKNQTLIRNCSLLGKKLVCEKCYTDIIAEALTIVEGKIAMTVLKK
jgi:cytochrome c-type biogenesis protein CcmH/NrfF